jgi:hypothetical protein
MQLVCFYLRPYSTLHIFVAPAGLNLRLHFRIKENFEIARGISKLVHDITWKIKLGVFPPPDNYRTSTLRGGISKFRSALVLGKNMGGGGGFHLGLVN